MIQNFLNKCLNKDPLKRATVDELLNDPFVNGVITKDYESDWEAMRYFRIFYNPFPTKLKLATVKILADNMTQSPEKMVRERFDILKSNQTALIGEKEIIQLALRCGYHIEIGQNISDHAISLFGQINLSFLNQWSWRVGIDLFNENDDGIELHGLKQIWYYTILAQHAEYRNRIFVVFDDDGDGFINATDVSMMFEKSTNFDNDSDHEKMFADIGLYAGNIHMMLREIDPHVEDVDKNGVSKEKFLQAMLQ